MTWGFELGQEVALRIRPLGRGAVNEIADYIIDNHSDLVDRATELSFSASPGILTGSGDPIIAEIYIKVRLETEADVTSLQEIIEKTHRAIEFRVELIEISPEKGHRFDPERK